MLCAIKLSVFLLSFIMLSVTMLYRYAECYECLYTEFHHAECSLSFVIMLSVVALNVAAPISAFN